MKTLTSIAHTQNVNLQRVRPGSYRVLDNNQNLLGLVEVFRKGPRFAHPKMLRKTRTLQRVLTRKVGYDVYVQDPVEGFSYTGNYSTPQGALSLFLFLR